jgi:hypothetical protein
MVGHRYGLLPSEVLAKATTLDLQVLDIALSYEHYRDQKAQGKIPEYKTDDLLTAFEEFKKQ